MPNVTIVMLCTTIVTPDTAIVEHKFAFVEHHNAVVRHDFATDGHNIAIVEHNIATVEHHIATVEHHIAIVRHETINNRFIFKENNTIAFKLIMKKHILLLAVLMFTLVSVRAQDKDPYTKPLKEVLKEVETRFNVSIKYDEKMVADRWVTKAPWRFRASVEKTLTNILMPLERWGETKA